MMALGDDAGFGKFSSFNIFVVMHAFLYFTKHLPETCANRIRSVMVPNPTKVTADITVTCEISS